MPGLEILLIAFGFAFGACFGSFFNVIIYRLPLEKSIVMPGSHCMSCNEPIRWFDNIPLISYIALGGKCRHCKEPFSFRYFVVEFLTGVLFALVVWKYWPLIDMGAPLKMTAVTLIHFYFVGGLVIVTFIDFDHKIIPNQITFSGIPIGLAAAFLFPEIMPEMIAGTRTHISGLLQSLLGAIVGGGFLYLVGAIGQRILKKEVMGFGDVKLLAMVGAFIGWKLTLLTIILSSFIGTLVGIMLIVMSRAKWQSQIPFGPYIVLGTLVSCFAGAKIVHWYMGFLRPPAL